MGLSMYRIRIADADDEEIAETLGDLHRLTFFDCAVMPQFELGTWWLAYHKDDPSASPAF